MTATYIRKVAWFVIFGVFCCSFYLCGVPEGRVAGSSMRRGLML